MKKKDPVKRHILARVLASLLVLALVLSSVDSTAFVTAAELLSSETTEDGSETYAEQSSTEAETMTEAEGAIEESSVEVELTADEDSITTSEAETEEETEAESVAETESETESESESSAGITLYSSLDDVGDDTESSTEATTEDGSEETTTTKTLSVTEGDYTVTVTYDTETGLSDDVVLKVDEYESTDDTYMTERAKAANLYGWDDRTFRLFDIGLYDANGDAVTLSGTVDVIITLAEQDSEMIYNVTSFLSGTATEVNATSAYDSTTQDQSISFSISELGDYGISPVVDADQGDIGLELNGDYAYLDAVAMKADSSTESGCAMRTGTSPWDADDENGNDSNDTNNILRTFDVATYTITFTSRVRSDAPYTYYYEGNLYFEFIIQGDSSEVQFETGSMGWLAAKNAEYTITEESVDGETCQVLRGYYSWKPASGNDHAIGESTQELSVAIRALALSDGDTIEPTFTLWLEGNEVGVDYSDWGTKDYAGDVVTGSGAVCSTHGETEYQTITAPGIEISAVANYNVVISASSESTTGTFDFSTGTDSALNKSAGSVTGRLGSYGITIQIVGKSAEQGLRGVQLPKSGEDITFTVTLSSLAQYSDTTKNTTEDFTPLVWSLEGNASGTTQTDGRTLPSELNRKYAPYAPFNKNTSGAYNSCYDGGTWSGSQTDNTVSITISNWQLEMDLDYLPYAYSAGSTLSTTYYDSSSVSNYWEIQYACISAGELWVVQPFYTTDGEYILDYLNTDDMSFTTTVRDSNFSMQDGNGNTITTQAITTDDTATQDMALLRPGTIIQSIAYQKYNRTAWNDPVTEGCWENPKDWILAGNQLAIFDWISNESAEGEYTAVAYDELIKFDDAFFEPDGTVTASTLNTSVLAVTPTILYGAKADKSGWSHTDSEGNELSPGDAGYDTEMINATTDDLVYFSSLDALEEAGYTCVAVLVEWRGLASTSYNHTDVTVKGSAKTTAETDCVYMVTHYGRSWNRSDLATACAESGNETYASYTVNDIVSMSAEEIKELVDELIPSRASTALDAGEYTADDALSYDTDYPSSCYWINGGSDGTSSQSNLIRNYNKASYDENGYVSGATSGVYYGDSCLLVGYTTGVTLNVAQTTTGGAEKAAYDMDSGQRSVDYELQATITRNNGESSSEGQTLTTDVTLTVTLDDGLTYLEDSSYFGGTYTTNGEGVQGTVTGGTKLIQDDRVTVTIPVYGEDDDGATVLLYEYQCDVMLEVSTDQDTGKTTLTYTLYGVELTSELTQYLDTIYFSCEIGTEGNEETDVQDGDSLNASATIESTEDCNREFTAANGNYSSVGILISKLSAAALSKFADQSVVEAWEDMGFTLSVANNSDNSTTIRAVEGLPYSTDGVSSFGGDVVVTEFSITSDNTADVNKLTFYYTTSEDYRGADSEALQSVDFATDSGWEKLEFDETGSAILPAEDSDGDGEADAFTPVAIVAVGTLDASKTLRMHITINLPDGEGGDYVVNKLSNYTTTTLSSSARSRIISRSLSGLAWVDLDGDGYQDSDENTISGVKVTLWKLKEDVDTTDPDYDATDTDNYECIAETSTGYTYDVQTGETENYTEGNYQFTSLSAGTYAVQFTAVSNDNATINDGKTTYFLMKDYAASPVDQAADAKDSDATGIYDSTNSLSSTIITDIDMPEAEDVKNAIYSSRHNDTGFMQYKLQVTKVIEDGSTLSGVEFKLQDSTYAEIDTQETNSIGLVTFGDPNNYKGLLPGTYCLTETVPDGYEGYTEPITITIKTDGSVEVETSSEDKDAESAGVSCTVDEDGVQLLKITITNVKKMTIELTKIDGEGVDDDSTEEDLAAAKKLSNATFVLYAEDDVTVSDSTATPNADATLISTATSGTDGVVKFTDSEGSDQILVSGTYYVFETVAPSGYELLTKNYWKVTVDTETQTFTVGATNSGYVFTATDDEGNVTYYIPNYTLYTLPQTTGYGKPILWITLLGCLLMLGAASLWVFRKRSHTV